MLYYRVETMDIEKSETVGGYVSALFAMTYKALGLVPGVSAETLCAALKNTDSKNARILYKLMAMLGSIAQPEVYIDDKLNHYCLYTRNEFFKIMPAFEEMDEVIRVESSDMYCLIYRQLEIPDDAILYRDEEQIVISREDYEKYVVSEDFHKVAKLDDDCCELGA
jgi:hypothetical protein